VTSARRTTGRCSSPPTLHWTEGFRSASSTCCHGTPTGRERCVTRISCSGAPSGRGGAGGGQRPDGRGAVPAVVNGRGRRGGIRRRDGRPSGAHPRPPVRISCRCTSGVHLGLWTSLRNFRHVSAPAPRFHGCCSGVRLERTSRPPVGMILTGSLGWVGVHDMGWKEREVFGKIRFKLRWMRKEIQRLQILWPNIHLLLKMLRGSVSVCQSQQRRVPRRQRRSQRRLLVMSKMPSLLPRVGLERN